MVQLAGKSIGELTADSRLYNTSFDGSVGYYGIRYYRYIYIYKLMLASFVIDFRTVVGDSTEMDP